LSKIIEFFKTTPGFDRVLRAMYDAYSHNGRVFGAIRLTRPNENEEAALSEFFKRDYYNQALIRIGLADFERQIQKNFPEETEEIRLGDVLADYLGTPKRMSSDFSQRGTFSSAITSELLPKYKDTPAAIWLKEITRQLRREYRRWAERYVNEPKITIEIVCAVSDALNNSPQGVKLVPLAEFSERFTNSPNAFDFHETHGILFLKALAFTNNEPAPENTEDCINLHLRAGIISCGKISGVTVHGLQSENETQMFTIENINNMENVSAHGNKVFIFEDPLIFNAVCERVGDFKCTIVQNNHSAAFMYLLKRFSAENISMRYVGNMTIKSLELTDNLYREFGKNFIPWRYEREDYEFTLSRETSFLPGEKKYLSLHNETLASLLSVMRKTGRTASSMPLLPKYIEDIKNIVHSEKK